MGFRELTPGDFRKPIEFFKLAADDVCIRASYDFMARIATLCVDGIKNPYHTMIDPNLAVRATGDHVTPSHINPYASPPNGYKADSVIPGLNPLVWNLIVETMQAIHEAPLDVPLPLRNGFWYIWPTAHC